MHWTFVFVTVYLLASVNANQYKSERVQRFHELRNNVPTDAQVEAKIPDINEIISNRTAAASNISPLLAGGSDVASSDYPWVGGVFEDYGGGDFQPVGVGVIVSKHWMICNVITFYIMSNPKYVFIVAGAANIFDRTTFHAHPREFHWYPDETGLSSATAVYLAMLKFCPGVPTDLVVPNPIPSSFPMSVHDPIIILSYDPSSYNKNGVSSNVGYPCECEWLSVRLSQIFCLTPDPATGPTNSEFFGPLAFTSDGKTFLGFHIVRSDFLSDAFIDIALFKTWIDSYIIE